MSIKPVMSDQAPINVYQQLLNESAILKKSAVNCYHPIYCYQVYGLCQTPSCICIHLGWPWQHGMTIHSQRRRQFS